MKNKIEVLCHSSIRIEGEKIIYIDPFKIQKNYNDADYIFCTHSHYDHFSKEDIQKVIKQNTILIVTKDIEKEAIEITNNKERVIIVEPQKSYKINGLEFETVPAYNVEKQFHPKANKWVRLYN